MFKLHVVQAEFGDSLILQYGKSKKKFILIDGGPGGVYDDSLRGELENIVGQNGTLEKVIITHVDIDHIKGILDFLAELESNKVNNEDFFINVDGLWLNSFSKTIDVNDNFSNRIKTIYSQAASNGINMAGTGIALNGIKEGHNITTYCTKLGIPMNSEAPAGIFRVGSPTNELDFDNLTFTIVGPTSENLDELKSEWEEWLSKHETEIANGNLSLLSMSDKSVPNLSSIMFLVEGHGKTILFTGDGRGDHLLEGLKKKKLLKDGCLHVNVFKVPHHGSDRNTDRAFFEKITADKYIISANGKHGNPDFATLTWIVEAAKEQERNIKLIITNETESTKKLVKSYPPDEYGYTIDYIEENKNSIEVVLN